MGTTSRWGILLGLAAGLIPAPVHAQGFGFGQGNPFAPFGQFGGAGGFNGVNGFGPAGNVRIWSTQQPILNVFNGQTSLLQVQQFAWYPVNVQVVQSGGQVVFVPQYQPLPIGNYWPVQAVASPNGILRVSTAPVISNAGPGPMFPIATFITPGFAGGAQGAPVPFTQVIGGPGFNTLGLNTTVGFPYGGNAVLGWYGMQGYGRTSFGAPIIGGFGFGGINFGSPRIFGP